MYIVVYKENDEDIEDVELFKAFQFTHNLHPYTNSCNKHLEEKVESENPP